MRNFIKNLLCAVVALLFALNSVFSVLGADEKTICEATDLDLAELERELSDEYLFISTYNYENSDMTKILAYIAFAMDASDYAQTVTGSGAKAPLSIATGCGISPRVEGYDPKGLNSGMYYPSYYKLPGDLTDFYIENIFHATPDHSYYDTYDDEECGYYYNGDYYFILSGLGGFMWYYKITDALLLDDGRYYITCDTKEYGSLYDSPTDVTVGNLYVLADLAELNGEKYWTFYKINYNPIDISGLTGGVKVYIDGSMVKFSQSESKPIIIDGYTYVPIRKICDALGLNLDWNADAKAFTINSGAATITHTPGTTSMQIDGAEKTFDKPSLNIDGTTYLPVRMLAEATNTAITWDGTSKSVYLTK